VLGVENFSCGGLKFFERFGMRELVFFRGRLLGKTSDGAMKSANRGQKREIDAFYLDGIARWAGSLAESREYVEVRSFSEANLEIGVPGKSLELSHGAHAEAYATTALVAALWRGTRADAR